MADKCIDIVFGGAFIKAWDNEDLKEAFNVMEKYDVHDIDTARLYDTSESKLGLLKAGERFTIHTKFPGGVKPGYGTRENVLETIRTSLEVLGVKQVDMFIIHAPDKETPIAETLAGFDAAHKLGYFKRFGLSNFFAEDVEKCWNTAKEHGYILPTVYQGNYGPVARRQEDLLFPTLRKLNISFYAYSPLAGGFLTKSADQIRAGQGRFNDTAVFGIYNAMYHKPSYLTALTKWEKIAEDEGVSRAELALRWVCYNCPLKKENGDGIVIGASNLKQLEEVLSSCRKGPLSAKAVAGIDDLWEDIKHEAPLDDYNDNVERTKGAQERFLKK